LGGSMNSQSTERNLGPVYYFNALKIQVGRLSLLKGLESMA